jgi:hypothetical protein
MIQLVELSETSRSLYTGFRQNILEDEGSRMVIQIRHYNIIPTITSGAHSSEKSKTETTGKFIVARGRG